MTEKQLMDAVVDAAKQLSTLQDALADYCLRTNKESLTVAEPVSQWIPVSEQLLDAYAQISKGAERMSNRDCKHGQLARSCNICDLEEEVNEKAETIAALEREVEALRKDAERLNHIERNWFYRDAFEELTFGFNETWSAGKHETLRDAIDAEINKTLAVGEAR